jgi:hypothetical protein
MLGLACCMPLTACGSDVDDLRAVRIEVVSERESLPSELRDWPFPGRIVRIELSTSQNIRTIARDKELNLRSDVYFCGDKAHVLSKLRYVFDSEGVLGHNPAPAQSGEGSSIYLYVAERAEAARDIESGERSIPAYDLSGDARDVCVQLHGYNMALEGFSSNVAMVKRQTIDEALKR